MADDEQRADQAPKNNYYKTLDQRDDRIKRASAAILQEDEKALEQVRDEQSARGLRGYEMRAEMERAEELASKAQREQWAKEDQQIDQQGQGRGTGQQQEQDDKTARLQKHLDQRAAQQQQERGQDQTHDIDH